MGYTDPTFNRDLLGNRSLLFIFICAFAVVTLLQQILYGRNYLKRYFEYYDGPFDYNSTKCLDLRREIMELKVLTVARQTELFERWKNLQICKWELNITEANFFKCTSLSDEMPYSRSQFKKCAVVGNGGILKNSGCGQEIDGADFVLRCNLPPISRKYVADVGVKTNVVTVNPSIIMERFQRLEKWRRPFYQVLKAYENASVLLPAFYNTHNTDVSLRVRYVLDDFQSRKAVYFFHPKYLTNVSRYWLTQGVRAKRITTGLILVTAALELCEEVHLFGFWGFPMNPSGIFITHHYYDNVKPRPGFHAMPSEMFNFLRLHSRGVLRVHTEACSYS
ncbi:alpha-2,8-sialyltransferase 8E [Pseudonaja textilis]|uniref:alpha-2,8-sialyltransferase 8E n=1 Tax=Pseudonaja textilis TaxID=8673 RepID=UPI000EA9D6E2|nr:alpha-2,8-sialyltransferase 8E [Pseudonaja textilis]